MSRAVTTSVHLAVLVLLSYLFLFHSLGAYSLKEPDEGRYAEIPREMVESGNYIVPYLNYSRYFEKPPLLYWAVALSYKAFGINEWAFRFPNALFAFLSVLTLYLFGRRWFGPLPAFLSSAILVSGLGFFSMARVVTTDMLLSFWLSFSILSFYCYYREKKSLFLYLFYVGLAFAALTKGPVALLLAGTSIVLFLAVEKRLSFLRELQWVKGIALFLAITAPWFIMVSLKEGNFAYFFFIDQNILRFLTSKHKRTGPVYYFLPVLFAGLFPWSLFLVRAAVRFWRDSGLRIFFVFACVVFVFFSLSGSKLPPYILPIFPPLSLILGRLVYDMWHVRLPGWEKWCYVFLFVLFAVGALLFMLGRGDSCLTSLRVTEPLVLSTLTPFAATISLLCFSLAVFLSFGASRMSTVFGALAFFSTVLMCGLLFSMPFIDSVNTTKQLASIINQIGRPNDAVVNYGSFEEALPFYTRRPVYIAAYRGELSMGSEYEDSKHLFLDDRQFTAFFNSDRRVFCVVKGKRLPHLKNLGVHARVLAREGEKCLISNY